MNHILFEAKLYRLKVLTNLHVGNGEADYSVIDKQVQRDVVTRYPQINASSLKGALREYMTFVGFKKSEGIDSTRVLNAIVFGSDPTESDREKKAKQGYVNFHDVKLLSLPIRTNHKPFMRATSKEVLYEYVEHCKKFGLDTSIDKETIRTLTTEKENGSIIAEDWKYGISSCTQEILESMIGEDVLLLEDEDFRTLAKELPFVARNYLENGKSENLWYEEIVPRESLFYFVIEKPVDDLLAYKVSQDNNPLLSTDAQKQSQKDILVREKFDTFDEKLDKAQLYIGANTTVGYGLCDISFISTNISTATNQGASDEQKAD